MIGKWATLTRSLGGGLDMPFVLTTSDRVMFVRAFGVCTSAELGQLATEAEAAEAEQLDSVDRVTDITNVERFEFDIRDLYHFAARRSQQRFSRVVKSAIVVADPEQFRVASLYAALNDNPQMQVRVMQRAAGATEWFAAAKADSTP